MSKKDDPTEDINAGLQNRIDKISQSEGYDKTRAMTLGLISGIPLIGGSLAALFEEYLPDWKFERIKEFLRKLSADMERLQSEVDKSKVETAAYGLLVEKVLIEVSRTAGEEKAAAYRAVLLNACSPSAPNQIEQEYMVGLLDRLKEIHVVLLSMFRDEHGFRAKHLEKVQLPPKLRYAERVEKCAAAIMQYLEPHGYDKDLVRVALKDLITMEILTGFRGPTEMLTETTRELSSHLQGLGRRFVDFIALPPSIA